MMFSFPGTMLMNGLRVDNGTGDDVELFENGDNVVRLEFDSSLDKLASMEVVVRGLLVGLDMKKISEKI